MTVVPMTARRMTRELLGLIALGALGCGGLVGGEQGHGGADQDAAGGTASSSSSSGLSGAGSSGASSGGSSSGTSSGNGSSSGGPSGSGSSGGVLIGSSSGPGPEEDASCSESILTMASQGTFADCWSCVAKGCEAQLTACAADCTCNADVAQAMECSEDGGPGPGPAGCFMSVLGSMNQAESAVGGCILQAGADCSCVSGAPPPGDGGCVPTGGGSSGGNGTCTSEFGESCGGMTYQVVCACPSGSCACFGPSSTTTFSFSGCPYCPGEGVGTTTSDDLLTQCGFPH